MTKKCNDFQFQPQSPSILWNHLEENGYYHFSNVFSPDQVRFAQSAMCKKLVHYQRMEHFIQEMIKFINQVFNWDAVFVKYRVSDHNNSSDAGAFHRDVLKYDSESLEPCFTVLTYLDSSCMEIIPKSHKYPHMTYGQALDQFRNNRLKVCLRKGDLLIFQSTLIHRGIFTENLPHRRLIQVFEVFPNQMLYNLFSPHLFHIPSSSTLHKVSPFLDWLYKYQLPSNILNYFGYFNAA